MILRDIHLKTCCYFAVLGWQNTCEGVENIRATLAALATEIDIGVLYRGLDPRNRHRLISMVYFSLILKFVLLDFF